MSAQRPRRPRPPLDEEGLERLALAYAGRYATTRARLLAYLSRKLSERGWAGAADPPLERLAHRFEKLGFVDDRAFAEARARSLGRRGYGERRVGQALKAAGIAAGDGEAVLEQAREEALASALRFARRRRIGPYSDDPADRDRQQRAAAAMLRAGHPLDVVRRVLKASPGEVPDPDVF